MAMDRRPDPLGLFEAYEQTKKKKKPREYEFLGEISRDPMEKEPEHRETVTTDQESIQPRPFVHDYEPYRPGEPRKPRGINPSELAKENLRNLIGRSTIEPPATPEVPTDRRYEGPGMRAMGVPATETPPDVVTGAAPPPTETPEIEGLDIPILGETAERPGTKAVSKDRPQRFTPAGIKEDFADPGAIHGRSEADVKEAELHPIWAGIGEAAAIFERQGSHIAEGMFRAARFWIDPAGMGKTEHVPEFVRNMTERADGWLARYVDFYAEPEKNAWLSSKTAPVMEKARQAAHEHSFAAGITQDIVQTGGEVLGLLISMYVTGGLGAKQGLTVAPQLSQIAGRLGRTAIHGVATTSGEFHERAEAGLYRVGYSATPYIARSMAGTMARYMGREVSPMGIDALLNMFMTSPVYGTAIKRAGGLNEESLSVILPQLVMDGGMALMTKNLPGAQAGKIWEHRVNLLSRYYDVPKEDVKKMFGPSRSGRIGQLLAEEVAPTKPETQLKGPALNRAIDETKKGMSETPDNYIPRVEVGRIDKLTDAELVRLYENAPPKEVAQRVSMDDNHKPLSRDFYLAELGERAVPDHAKDIVGAVERNYLGHLKYRSIIGSKDERKAFNELIKRDYDPDIVKNVRAIMDPDNSVGGRIDYQYEQARKAVAENRMEDAEAHRQKAQDIFDTNIGTAFRNLGRKTLKQYFPGNYRVDDDTAFLVGMMRHEVYGWSIDSNARAQMLRNIRGEIELAPRVDIPEGPHRVEDMDRVPIEAVLTLDKGRQGNFEATFRGREATKQAEARGDYFKEAQEKGYNREQAVAYTELSARGEPADKIDRHLKRFEDVAQDLMGEGVPSRIAYSRAWEDLNATLRGEEPAETVDEEAKETRQERKALMQRIRKELPDEYSWLTSDDIDRVEHLADVKIGQGLEKVEVIAALSELSLEEVQSKFPEIHGTGVGFLGSQEFLDQQIQEAKTALKTADKLQKLGVPVLFRDGEIPTYEEALEEARTKLRAGMERVEEEPEATPEERRKERSLRAKVEELSPEEREEVIHDLRRRYFTDDMTGLLNKAAYLSDERLPFQAVIDLDGLKWINDNYGHEAGDNLIKAFSALLPEDFSYHLSGDEFAIQAWSREDLENMMAEIERLASESVLELSPDTAKAGIDFSYGIGETQEQADAAMQEHKQARAEAGQRADRGEEPQGITQVQPEEPVKEPWEMTKEEFARQETGKMREREMLEDYVYEKAEQDISPEVIAKDLGITKEEVDDIIASFRLDDVADVDAYDPALAHRSAVQQALAENKPVPQEVLAEYPDLAPEVTPAETVTETPAAPIDTSDVPDIWKSAWQNVEPGDTVYDRQGRPHVVSRIDGNRIFTDDIDDTRGWPLSWLTPSRITTADEFFNTMRLPSGKYFSETDSAFQLMQWLGYLKSDQVVSYKGKEYVFKATVGGNLEAGNMIGEVQLIPRGSLHKPEDIIIIDFVPEGNVIDEAAAKEIFTLQSTGRMLSPGEMQEWVQGAEAPAQTEPEITGETPEAPAMTLEQANENIVITLKNDQGLVSNIRNTPEKDTAMHTVRRRVADEAANIIIAASERGTLSGDWANPLQEQENIDNLAERVYDEVAEETPAPEPSREMTHEEYIAAFDTPGVPIVYSPAKLDDDPASDRYGLRHRDGSIEVIPGVPYMSFEEAARMAKRRNIELHRASKPEEPVTPETPEEEAPAPEAPAETPGITWRRNEELGGVEIAFPAGERPDEATKRKMKRAGFKWSSKKGHWWAKETPGRVALAKEIAGDTERELTPEQRESALERLWAQVEGKDFAEKQSNFMGNIPPSVSVAEAQEWLNRMLADTGYRRVEPKEEPAEEAPLPEGKAKDNVAWLRGAADQARTRIKQRQERRQSQDMPDTLDALYGRGREWFRDIPGEVYSRLESAGVSNEEMTLERALDEAEYLITLIEEGGTDYDEVHPQTRKKYIRQSRNFINKYEDALPDIMELAMPKKKASLPMDDLVDYAVVGAEHLATKNPSYQDWAELMLEEFGPSIKLFLGGIYGQSQAMLEMTPEEINEMIGIAEKEEVPADEPVQPGQKPLEEVPSEDVRRTGEERRASEGGQRSRREDGERTGATPGAGPEVRPGMGDSPRTVHPTTGREGRAEARGAPGTVEDEAAPKSVTGQNFRITPEFAEHIDTRGKKQKTKDNIAAIRLLKQIQGEERPATPEEQAVLVKYVGWGFNKDIFSEAWAKNNNYLDEHMALKELLTDEEFKNARSSTLFAHYTATDIVSGMYDTLSNIGFDGGRVLEPALGIGHFFGLMPENLAKASRLTGVELDPVSGEIAKLLYPRASINVMGYERFNVPYDEKMLLNQDHYDLAISNVPFNQYGPADDQRYRDIPNRNLHNFFFAKAIDQVRPGGVLMFVTSHYTMDNRRPEFREYMDRKADFLGAVRLHNEAFKGIAETSVVTDIIVMRKRDPGDTPAGEAWTNVERVNVGERFVTINEYYETNPEMIIGKNSIGSGMYGSNEYMVTPDPERTDLRKEIAEAFAKILPADAYRPKPKHEGTEAAKPEDMKIAPPEAQEGSFIIKDKKIHSAQVDKDGNLVLLDLKDLSEVAGIKIGEKSQKRIRGLIKVREAYTELVNLEVTDAAEADMKKARAKLNKVYDEFVKTHGHINSRQNAAAFRDDPSYYRLTGLEIMDPATGETVKNDIFRQRAIRQYTPAVSAETAEQALLITLNEKNRVDLEHMSWLTGKDIEQIKSELEGRIYNDPEKGWITADEYLSGNVRQKLLVAQEAAEQDPQYKPNVEALQAAQPRDLKPEEIYARLGASWIPTEDIRDFVKELLDAPAYYKLVVVHEPSLGMWRLQFTDQNQRRAIKNSAENTSKWGLEFYDRERDINIEVGALTILEKLLNSKSMTATYRQDYTDEEGNKKHRYPVHQAASIALKEKARHIENEFTTWLWKDEERAKRLQDKYNWEFNNIRIREWDGSHLTFPGINPAIQLGPHQKNAVWQIVQGVPTLLHHTVGAGKTWEMVAGAMELKRLGIANKPVLVTRNHLVGDIYNEARRLYPSAKMVYYETKDLAADKRKKTLARIAAGDWDLIIMPHSSFKMIPMSADRVENLIDYELNKVAAAVSEAKALMGKEGKSVVKDMENAMRAVDNKLRSLLENIRKHQDKGFMNFEETGMDAIFLDEAHHFKNLFYSTSMSRVGNLGNPTGSQAAFDVFTKTNYVRELRGGSGLVFATATPLSNTMAEIYNMQRYLMPEMLEERGINSFDAWARTFGEVVTSVELKPSGKGFQPKDRFRKFNNLGELIQMYHSFANVVNREKMLEMNVDMVLPKISTGKRIMNLSDPSEELSEYIESLDGRLDAVRAGNPLFENDNTLNIMTDGKMAALYGPLRGLPDYKGSKISNVADKVHELWETYKDAKSTQLVFLDLGTPKGKAGEIDEDTGDYKMTDEEKLYQAELEAQEKGVYEVIKRKLIVKGVPEEEIAIIHDYVTDNDKKGLFRELRRGDKRVLIGSTEKMGEGMNVQDKLIAIHHVDAQWKPAQIEQREGRAIRQGNENEEVFIYAYSTSGTLDTFFWQTLEQKQGYLARFEAGDVNMRDMADVDDTEADFATLKALATGNPLIVEHAELTNRLIELKSMEQGYQSGQTTMRLDIARAKKGVDSANKNLTALKKDLASRQSTKGDKFRAILFGKEYTERKDAAAILTGEEGPLKEALKRYANKKDTLSVAELQKELAKIPGMTAKLETYETDKGETFNNIAIDIGEFAGYPLFMEILKGKPPLLVLQGEIRRYTSLQDTAMGTVRALENLPMAIEREIEEANTRIERLQKDIETWEAELAKPFEHEEELLKAVQRKEELEVELGMKEAVDPETSYTDEDEVADPVESKETIEIKNEDGTTRKVPGEPVAPGLAIVQDRDTMWGLTHTASGMGFGFRYKDKEVAHRAAMAISGLADWTAEIGEITSDKDMLAQVKSRLEGYKEEDLQKTAERQVDNNTYDHLLGRSEITQYDVETLQHAPAITSRKQVAKGLKTLMQLVERNAIEKPAFHLDVGGGAYDEGMNYLAEQGIEGILWDPEARPPAYNEASMERLKQVGGANTASLNNVLNVLPEKEERLDAIRFMFNHLQTGGTGIITVHEGKGNNRVEKVVKGDRFNYQLNRKLDNYLPEIKEALPGNIAQIEKRAGAFVITKTGRLDPLTVVEPEALSNQQPLWERDEYRAIRPEGKIGKRTRDGNLYLHKKALDTLPAADKKVIKEARKKIPEDFGYHTIVKYHKPSKTVSFIKSPDFDTADEPVVGDSLLVREDGSTRHVKGRTDNPQIYHHKWMMVKDSYRGFDVQAAKERSEWWENRAKELNIKVNRSQIGNMNEWNKLLERLGETRPTYIDKPIYQEDTDDHLPEILDSIEKKDPEKYKAATNALKDDTGDKVLDRVVHKDKLINKIDETVSLYIGRVKGKRAGYFQSKEELVRIRSQYFSDLDILTHEMGHYLDKALMATKRRVMRMAMQKELGDRGYEILASELLAAPYVQEVLLENFPDADFKLQMHEGFADFIRAYIVEPEMAEENFPNFHTYFERLLGTAGDDMVERIGELQRMTQLYINQEPEYMIASFIGSDEKPKKSILADLYYKIVDESGRIAYVIEQIIGDKRFWGKSPGGVDVIAPDKNAFLLNKVSRSFQSRAHQFVRYGQYERDDKNELVKVGPSLDEITVPIFELGKHDNGVSHFDRWTYYMVSKRAIEIEDVKELKSGMDKYQLKQARDFVDSIEGNKEKGIKKSEHGDLYQKQFERLVEFTRFNMRQLVEAGIMSWDSYQQIVEENQFYIPFYRVRNDRSAKKAEGQQLGNMPKGVYKYRGASLPIYDPWHSILRQVFIYTAMADKNKALNALVDMADEYEGTGEFFTKIPAPAQVTKATLGEVLAGLGIHVSDETALEKLGEAIAEETGTNDIDVDKIVKIFRPTQYANVQQNLVTTWKDGKPVFYEFKDKELLKAIMHLDTDAVNLLDKLARPFSKMLRVGATWNPRFIGFNPFRDNVLSGVWGEDGYVPFVDLFRGVFHIANKSGEYQDWLNAGGAMNTLNTWDRNYFKEYVGKYVEQKYHKEVLKAINPLGILGRASGVMEYATNVGQYAKARKRGAHPILATFLGRDLTVDHLRHGSQTHSLRTHIPFLNSAIQGQDKAWRAFKKNPTRFTFRALLMITLPTVALFLWNRRNPYYQELPAWRKNLFWNIPMGLSPNTKYFIWLPRPFIPGLVFGGMVEYLMNVIDKENRAVWDDLSQDIFNTATPNYMPAWLGPLLELWGNQRLLSGAPVVPASEERLWPSDQYGPYTSEVAKKMGKLLNKSPRKIDALIYGYTAGLGRYAVNGVDELLYLVGAADKDLKPAGTVRDVPLLGDIIVASGSYGAASVTRLYSDLRKAEQIAAKEQRALERGEVISLTEKEQLYRNHVGTLRSVARDASEINREISYVHESKTLSRDEKRYLIDMLELAKLNNIRAAYGLPIIPME